jgi:hypothetical protein
LPCKGLCSVVSDQSIHANCGLDEVRRQPRLVSRITSVEENQPDGLPRDLQQKREVLTPQRVGACIGGLEKKASVTTMPEKTCVAIVCSKQT